MVSLLGLGSGRTCCSCLNCLPPHLRTAHRGGFFVPVCANFDATDTLLQKNRRFAFIFSLGFSLCSLNFFYDCRYCFSTRVEFNPCQQAPQRGAGSPVLTGGMGSFTQLWIQQAHTVESAPPRLAGGQRKQGTSARNRHPGESVPKYNSIQTTVRQVYGNHLTAAPSNEGHLSSGLVISNEVSPVAGMSPTQSAWLMVKLTG